MKLSKIQIQEIARVLASANKATARARILEQKLAEIISQHTGVNGFVDELQGDGMGFTPESNNDTHIYVGDLISAAKKGIDINEDWMLNNLTI